MQPMRRAYTFYVNLVGEKWALDYEVFSRLILEARGAIPCFEEDENFIENCCVVLTEWKVWADVVGDDGCATVEVLEKVKYFQHTTNGVVKTQQNLLSSLITSLDDEDDHNNKKTPTKSRSSLPEATFDVLEPALTSPKTPANVRKSFSTPRSMPELGPATPTSASSESSKISRPTPKYRPDFTIFQKDGKDGKVSDKQESENQGSESQESQKQGSEKDGETLDAQKDHETQNMRPDDDLEDGGDDADDADEHSESAASSPSRPPTRSAKTSVKKSGGRKPRFGVMVLLEDKEEEEEGSGVSSDNCVSDDWEVEGVLEKPKVKVGAGSAKRKAVTLSKTRSGTPFAKKLDTASPAFKRRKSDPMPKSTRK
ncbi:hypothetical protein HK104_005379 [Borealophlyctis nickersoniae]|nr:hypothetical protein HK104_005379 [Borealophlyctis nickersoniae]